MAINWTEAQIQEVIASVIKNLGAEAPAKGATGWSSTEYEGRPLIGVYADMNDAIDAATQGYKAIRAMSLEEREKLIETMTREMKEAARRLDFERAAYLRDEIKRIRED